MKTYYVYTIYDTEGIRYIGKGTEDRVTLAKYGKYHNPWVNLIPLPRRVEVVFNNTCEREALEVEKQLIELHKETICNSGCSTVGITFDTLLGSMPLVTVNLAQLMGLLSPYFSDKEVTSLIKGESTNRKVTIIKNNPEVLKSFESTSESATLNLLGNTFSVGDRVTGEKLREILEGFGWYEHCTVKLLKKVFEVKRSGSKYVILSKRDICH